MREVEAAAAAAWSWAAAESADSFRARTTRVAEFAPEQFVRLGSFPATRIPDGAAPSRLFKMLSSEMSPFPSCRSFYPHSF